MRRTTLVFLAATAFLAGNVLLTSVACNSKAPPAKPVAAEPAKSTGKAHWVQTPQLKGLMQRLSFSTAANWPKTMPGDVESPGDPAAMKRTYEAAASLSDALATAADRIPDAANGKDLAPETLRGFLAEAAILRAQAAELGREARTGRGEAMARTLDQINATCVTCHSRYRDIAGTLDFPRADAHSRVPLAIAR